MFVLKKAYALIMPLKIASKQNVNKIEQLDVIKKIHVL